jgi:replication factor C subunit 2/4
VRNRIKGFAQKKVTLPPGRHKIVILDEADRYFPLPPAPLKELLGTNKKPSMTPGAQQALRRTMEIYASTTRFALACNQSNKIIEAIQSRCAILRYSRLTDQQLLTRLLQICEAEDISHTEDGLAALIFSAEGDMRQAVNNLQSTVAGFGLVNGENVFKVCDQPHPIAVQNLLRRCNKGNVEDALESLRELWGKGYSAVDIIGTMFRVVKTMDVLSEYMKLEFIKVFYRKFLKEKKELMGRKLDLRILRFWRV